jgi:hypothetical protein
MLRKEVVVAYSEVISGHFPGRSEEGQEASTWTVYVPAEFRNENLQYTNSEAPPLEITCSVFMMSASVSYFIYTEEP